MRKREREERNGSPLFSISIFITLNFYIFFLILIFFVHYFTSDESLSTWLRAKMLDHYLKQSVKYSLPDQVQKNHCQYYGSGQLTYTLVKTANIFEIKLYYANNDKQQVSDIQEAMDALIISVLLV